MAVININRFLNVTAFLSETMICLHGIDGLRHKMPHWFYNAIFPANLDHLVIHIINFSMLTCAQIMAA
jgi:hypothetical protein